MSILFHITPIGAPRQSRRDTWNPSPAVLRYRAFKDELREQVQRAGYRLGDTLDITFRLPMPVSWSQKKRQAMNGKPHQQKPDTDNMVKAFTDALTKEDCAIYEEHARKYWAVEGSIVVET